MLMHASLPTGDSPPNPKRPPGRAQRSEARSGAQRCGQRQPARQQIEITPLIYVSTKGFPSGSHEIPRNSWIVGNLAGSYTFNGCFYADVPTGPDSRKYYYKMLGTVPHSSQTPLMTDGPWLDTWVWGPPLPTTTALDLYNGKSSTSLGRLAVARHGSKSAASAPRSVPAGQPLPGSINMIVADGHAESVRLQNLNSFYWNAIYVMP